MQVWGRSFKDGTGIQRTPALWRKRPGRWRWCGADRGLGKAAALRLHPLRSQQLLFCLGLGLSPAHTGWGGPGTGHEKTNS